MCEFLVIPGLNLLITTKLKEALTIKRMTGYSHGNFVTVVLGEG